MCYINEASYTAASLLIISEVLNTRTDASFAFYAAGDADKFGGSKSTTAKNYLMNIDDD